MLLNDQGIVLTTARARAPGGREQCVLQYVNDPYGSVDWTGWKTKMEILFILIGCQKLLKVKIIALIGPKLLDEFLPNGSMDGLASMWGAKTPPAKPVLPPRGST